MSSTPSSPYQFRLHVLVLAACLGATWLIYHYWLRVLLLEPESFMYGASSVILLIGLAIAFSCTFGYLKESKAKVQDERKQDFDSRGELRRAVRTFAHEQIDEYSWLLQKPKDEQHRWANQPGRFREIIEDWARSKEHFNRLRGDDRFEQVKADLGEISQQLERIWAARMELFRYARAESNRVERVRTDAEEQFGVRTTQLEFQDRAERLQGERAKRLTGEKS